MVRWVLTRPAGLVIVLSLLVLCAHKDIACNAKEQFLFGLQQKCCTGAKLHTSDMGNTLQHTWFMAFEPGEMLQVARMSSEVFG